MCAKNASAIDDDFRFVFFLIRLVVNIIYKWLILLKCSFSFVPIPLLIEYRKNKCWAWVALFNSPSKRKSPTYEIDEEKYRRWQFCDYHTTACIQFNIARNYIQTVKTRLILQRSNSLVMMMMTQTTQKPNTIFVVHFCFYYFFLYFCGVISKETNAVICGCKFWFNKALTDPQIFVYI